MTVEDKVKSGEIRLCCWDCAEKHRKAKPYDGTYNCRVSACQICKETKKVTSASKLLGFHKFM